MFVNLTYLLLLNMLVVYVINL